MFNVTRLIHTSDPDRLLPELRALAAAADRAVVQPTLPGVRNGGDILMHLRFAVDAQWASVADEFAALLSGPAVSHVDGAQYRGMPDVSDQLAPDAVYRTLLLRVGPGSDAAAVKRFEDDLRLLPRYVPSITSWQLSRVESAVGTSSWTHVFEQEFRDLEALTGPYLMHPIHWAYVDRWFDPECPDVIVRDRVCHSFCRCDTVVLG
jgi:stress responsive alpha/beta barrel protein